MNDNSTFILESKIRRHIAKLLKRRNALKADLDLGFQKSKELWFKDGLDDKQEGIMSQYYLLDEVIGELQGIVGNE